MSFNLSSSSARSPAPEEKRLERSVVAFSQPKLFNFKRSENLHSRRSDGLWRIQSGYVRSLTWNSEGEPVPLGFWSKGDIVGDVALQRNDAVISQGSYYQVQCLTAVSAEYLGKPHDCLQSVMLAQLSQSNDLLKIAHCRQSEQRLLKFICWIANLFGEPTLQGRRIPIKLTHQEISESIGSTRVTVTRFLKILERDGKISWTAHERIVYKDTFEQLEA